MVWGILIIVLLSLFIAYVIGQEMRAHRHWRKLVAGGDITAIDALVRAEIERWHIQRTPRGIPASLWHGIQTTELQQVGADNVRVSASTEAQYAVVNGAREEISSALQEGKRLTAKLAEMLLYDIPNVRLDTIQIDVYTTFRDPSGRSTQECILSSVFQREEAAEIDWDETTAEQVVAAVGGRYRLNEQGLALPIDPDIGAAKRIYSNGTVAQHDKL
jgi:hypothetical protein